MHELRLTLVQVYALVFAIFFLSLSFLLTKLTFSDDDRHRVQKVLMGHVEVTATKAH
jgi:hypothetical protein